VPDRLPPPGPSFIREQDVRIGDRRLHAGMSRPTNGPEEWWLTVLWVADDEGVASFTDVAPSSGPPADPPLARLGPAIAGALSGLIREENGRLAVRLTPVVAPEDATRPWRCPLAVRAAFKWEAVRQASLPPAQLAEQVLTAFRGSVEGLHRR
jgi:hypothetical protein